jgi:hypothetical protein
MVHSQIKGGGWGRISSEINTQRDMRTGALEGEIDGEVKFGGELGVGEERRMRDRKKKGSEEVVCRKGATVASALLAPDSLALYSSSWQGLIHVYLKSISVGGVL